MIETVGKKFIHDLGAIYDAEHRFLDAQQQMLEKASSPMLREMLVDHIAQTREQISNLDMIYRLMAASPIRGDCPAAAGLVAEGEAAMRGASAGELLDTVIASAAGKVEHYEMACYRNLLATAEHFGQPEVSDMLRRNLEQEERTAKKVEDGYARLLGLAISTQKLQSTMGGAAVL